MSREYTEDEIREQFLKHCWHTIDYWITQGSGDCRERMSGVVFSILTMLDGCNMALPGFIVAPSTHPSDKIHHQGLNENWYPQNHETNVKADIGGCLHELFHQHDPQQQKPTGVPG